MKEVLHDQLEDLRRLLPQYEFIGVGRDDGKAGGEYNPIMFHRARFTLLDSGTLWLSETPHVVGSKGWDADLPRVLTWA